MSRTTDPAVRPPESADPGSNYVCPFCGLEGDNPEHDELTPCARCGIMDSAATRKATKQRIGPWHVRQAKNPWAPGMRWETLVSLVRRGQVTPNSIVRGPTTHQLWKRAVRVKGLSREWGFCYSCGEGVEKDANLCSHCNRLQEPPANPDVLLETREAAASAPAASLAAPAIAAAPALIAMSSPRNGNGSGESVLAASSSDLAVPAPAPAPLPAASRSAAAKTEMPVMRSTSGASNSMDVLRRPVPQGEADALLTAQELATAFKLDFKPKGGKSKPASRGRMGKVMFVVLLLALSVGALAYVKPEYREKSVGWMQDQYQAVRGKFSAMSAHAPATPKKTDAADPSRTSPFPVKESSSAEVKKAPVKATPATIEHAPMPRPAAAVEPKQKPVEIDPPVKPPVVEQSATVASVVSKPTTAPAPLVVTTPAPAPTPVPTPAPAAAPVVEKTTPPAPAPAPKTAPAPAPAPVAAKVPAPAPSPAVESVDPVERARELWRKAIDAEGNQDFVEAVKCYEQIKKLPADAQPEGVDVRLELARKQTR
ncbi:MAG TPA: hypothetical protein VF669_23605 [Tepidisphaeraceae bacterium]